MPRAGVIWERECRAPAAERRDCERTEKACIAAPRRAEATHAPATPASGTPPAAAAAAAAAAGSAPPAGAAAPLSARSGWHVGRGRREGHHDGASTAGSQKRVAASDDASSPERRQRQWSRAGSRSGRHEGEGDRAAEAEAEAEGEADGDTVTSTAGHDGHGVSEGHTRAAACVGLAEAVAVLVDEDEGDELTDAVGEGDGVTSEAGPDVGASTTRPGPPRPALPGAFLAPPQATRRAAS